jgi:hypothetical protein
MARVVKQHVLKVPGVLGLSPKPLQRLRRAPGIRLVRRRNGTIFVKAWVTVAHDAGAIPVARMVQAATTDAVQQTSGEPLDRVIVVISQLKMLRPDARRANGEAL